MLLVSHTAPNTYVLQHALIYVVKCYGSAWHHKLENRYAVS